MAARRRVVVTGLGLVTPLGLSVKGNWEKALVGISGIARYSGSASENCPTQAVGAVSADDWATITEEFRQDRINEGERRSWFALWAAKAALADAGILAAFETPERAGVAFAAGLGIDRPEDIHRWLSPEGEFDAAGFGREYQAVHPESIIRNPSHRAAALIARKFSLRGPNCTVTTACASATQSIGLGCRAVQRGNADLMLVGGADSMVNPVGLVYFVLLQAAARSALEPPLLCRPFDRRRSGLVMGEGAGVAILEAESRALERGARIYAEVVGYGSSMDAYQVTAPHPEGNGAALSMKAALEDANLAPQEIDYINAHGTGTKLNDIAETLAIKRVFGDHAYRVAVSSSKSLIGHLMAAAGGPEFVYTVLSVQRNEIHPTLNLTQADPKCDLDYVPDASRAQLVRAALTNSFGFGGQNGTVVVKKYTGPAAG